MGNRGLITREDGETIDLDESEAESYEIDAKSKRVILTDSDGTPFSSTNPLNVDTEISLNGDLIVENVTVASLRGTVLSTSVTIGDSATLIPSSDLANRKSMTIRNNGSNTIFIGGSGVSTSNGFPIKVNESMDIDLDDASALYGIVATGNEDLRILEIS